MVDSDAADAANIKHAASLGMRPAPLNLVRRGDVVECALASISETDMMLVGIGNYGVGRVADPRSPRGRAALYSLAFMLRRAAAVRLDVQDYELKAGIRSHEDPAGGVVGQVFLSDTLENGAGYATYLGTPAPTEELLRMICEPGAREFHQILVGTAHEQACDTSCPDCLRSYSNLAYHNLLDWRLAIDMASLALDSQAPITLASPYWQRASRLAALALHAARPNWTRLEIVGLPALAHGREVIIVTHPLWATTRVSLGPELEAAWDDAERVRGFNVDESRSFVSVFEALRRPM